MDPALTALALAALLAPADPAPAGPAAASPSTVTSAAEIHAPPAEDGVVRVQLLPRQDRWLPGRRQLVGVHFEMEEGWHLYWPGLNDSGLPIELTPRGPEGVTFGEVAWPAPSRYLSPGELVDHVYHDEVTLLLPVTLPAEPPADGGRLRIEVGADWLVCEEACVRGGVTVELSMTLAADGQAGEGPGAGPIAATQARLPGPAPEALAVGWADAAGDDAVERGLRLTVPGAARLAFYPAATSLYVVDVYSNGEAEGDTLELVVDLTPPYAPPDEEPPPPRVAGVLEIWREGAEASELARIDLAPPGEGPRGG